MHRPALPANAVIAAVSVLALLPASTIAAYRFAHACASSMETAGRSMILWAVGVALLTAVVMMRRGPGTFALSLLVQLAIVGAAAIALPNLDFGDADRSRQKRTIAAMRSIATAIDEVRLRTGTYPVVTGVAELQRLTTRKLPLTDGWSNAFALQAGRRGYTLSSPGLCGEESGEPNDVRNDIVVRNGTFVRKPAWYESTR
jgi:type II secretory pathway pseudopilin PulG